MRKLVLSLVVSVDGYINGPGGEFIGPEWSADLDGWNERLWPCLGCRSPGTPDGPKLPWKLP